jgi:hypothetical protein
MTVLLGGAQIKKAAEAAAREARKMTYFNGTSFGNIVNEINPIAV